MSDDNDYADPDLQPVDPPVDNVPPGEGWQERPADEESISSIAKLVAMTNNELNQIDSMITDGSNLTAKSAGWNPEAIVKREVQAAELAGTIAQGPAPAVAPSAGTHPLNQPMQPVIQQAPIAPIYAPGSMPFVTDPQVIKRLEDIESRLQSLQITFDGILKNMLRNKTKQITIRFDDPKTTKQK